MLRGRERLVPARSVDHRLRDADVVGALAVAEAHRDAALLERGPPGRDREPERDRRCHPGGAHGLLLAWLVVIACSSLLDLSAGRTRVCPGGARRPRARSRTRRPPPGARAG